MRYIDTYYDCHTSRIPMGRSSYGELLYSLIQQAQSDTVKPVKIEPTWDKLRVRNRQVFTLYRFNQQRFPTLQFI